MVSCAAQGLQKCLYTQLEESQLVAAMGMELVHLTGPVGSSPGTESKEELQATVDSYSPAGAWGRSRVNLGSPQQHPLEAG